MTTTVVTAPLPFVEVSRVFFCTAQDRIYSNNAVYAMIGTAMPAGPQKSNVWNRVDLKPWGVPADAKVALMSGILIITHGTEQQLADMHITFRRPSDTTADVTKYCGQICEASIGGGQRVPFSAWVALEDGVFDWAFWIAEPHGWPTYASYGINLGVEAYAI